MRLQLTGAAFHRARAAWPPICCGCGAPSTATFPAFARKSAMSTAGTLLGLAGHGAHWTTYSVRLPACLRCRRRGHVVPVAWAALCVLLFAAGLAAAKAGLHHEADGTPIVGAARALRLGLFLGFPVAVFLGPPVFLILQRRAAPATISELRGASWEELEAVELDCGSEDFVRAVERG